MPNHLSRGMSLDLEIIDHHRVVGFDSGQPQESP